MTTIILAIACLAALTGGLTRNMSAWALLGSCAFSTLLCALGVPFNFILWLCIDLSVILCIIHPGMRWVDLAIITLFAPIWVLYIAQPSWASSAIDLLVVCQMLLTFPAKQAGTAFRGRMERLGRDDDQSMRVAHA